MLLDGLVRKCAYEIGLPIPLHARQIETIEHALKRGMRNRPYQVERRNLEISDRLENFLRLLDGSGIAPHDAAHFLAVQMLGERRPRRHGMESKEPVDVSGRLCDEAAVPLHSPRTCFLR